jgi:hypothetical protein
MVVANAHFLVLLKASHAMLLNATLHHMAKGVTNIVRVKVSIHRFGENRLKNDASVVDNVHFSSFLCFLRHAT